MTETEKLQISDLRIKGVGYKAIAAIVGVSRDSIKSYCKRNLLDGNSQFIALNIEEKVKQHLLCACCSKPIIQKVRGRSRRFCSEGCRRKWWNENQDKRSPKEEATYMFICPACSKEFKCYGNKNRKYCSHNCFIKARFWREEEDGV